MAGVSLWRQVPASELVRHLNRLLKIDVQRAAAVTVDMHRGHLDPAVATEPVPAEQAARVVERCSRFLAALRAREIPIIHVVLKYRSYPEPALERAASPFKRAVDLVKQELLGLPSTLREHNVEGRVQTEIIPALYRPTDHVIDCKKRLSAFYGTDLEILLRCLRRDTLLLCGINTNTCVLCTAFEASNRDMKAVVVSDCCASLYDDSLHEFALDNVARCFGWVLTSDEVLAKLERGDGEI